MMKLFKPLMILSVIMLIFSCSSDDANEGRSDTTLNLNDPHMTCGHPDSEIEKRHNVIANWTPPSPCEAAELKIFIDQNCVGTEWIAAINATLDAYNAIAGSSIFFTTTTDPNEADIDVNCLVLGGPFSGAGGVGALPVTDGVIGSFLTLNLTALDFCNDSDDLACFLQHIVMHEIGHTLGLSHNEDIGFASNGVPVEWIPGTSPNNGEPDYGDFALWPDDSSIFNSSVGCPTTCHFNANDIIAFQTLYPEATIEGPECVEIGDEGEYCFTGVEDIPNGEITWSLNGSSTTPPVGDYCNSFTFNDAGIQTISAKFCVNDCCETVTTTVWVIDPDDKCYCVCDAVDTVDDVPFTEYIEVDCCDRRSCAEIMFDGGWGEIISNPEDDCIKITNPCKGTPPQFTTTGPTEICEEDGYVTICVSGYSGSTSWTISSTNGNDTESSPNSCLSYDVEPGTYTFSTRICEGDCCVNLTHTATVTSGPCEEECYCVCEEGDGEGNYTTVELPIDCSEDCAEQYPEGDEYFDCRKMVR